MKHSFKIISKFLVFFLGGLLVGYFCYILISNRDLKQKETVGINQVIPLISEFYQFAWEKPTVLQSFRKNTHQCPSISFNPNNVGDMYFECNSELFQCFIENRFKDFSSNHKLKFNETLFESRASIESATDDVLLTIEIISPVKYSWKLKLNNTCKQVNLPERIYNYGPVDKDGFQWDTIGRKIFIDKRLVTNKEIYFWSLKNSKMKHLVRERKLDYLPATHLNFAEKFSYCSEHKKKLMEAHIWQAASYFVQTTTNKTPDYIYKHPYPWGRDQKFEFGTSLESCRRAWVQECEFKFKRIYFDDENTSWIGMYDILGGEYEYLVNPIDPDQNIKLSSKYLSGISNKHKIGELGKSMPEMMTAFRCYQEKFNE